MYFTSPTYLGGNNQIFIAFKYKVLLLRTGLYDNILYLNSKKARKSYDTKVPSYEYPCRVF